jgi:hypothetical protein
MAGVSAEWEDIVRDLDRVEQLTLDQDVKRLVLRPHAPGCAGSVFQAVGVALLPLLRQSPPATPPPTTPLQPPPYRRPGRPGVVPRQPEFSGFLFTIKYLQIHGVQLKLSIARNCGTLMAWRGITKRTSETPFASCATRHPDGSAPSAWPPASLATAQPPQGRLGT